MRCRKVAPIKRTAGKIWGGPEVAKQEVKMNPAFSHMGRKLDASDLKQLEGVIGSPLPKEFEKFLKSHSGGSPSPSTFAIEEVGEEYDLQFFFCIHSKMRANDLA